jgi:hypothetical protein
MHANDAADPVSPVRVQPAGNVECIDGRFLIVDTLRSGEELTLQRSGKSDAEQRIDNNVEAIRRQPGLDLAAGGTPASEGVTRIIGGGLRRAHEDAAHIVTGGPQFGRNDESIATVVARAGDDADERLR